MFQTPIELVEKVDQRPTDGLKSGSGASHMGKVGLKRGQKRAPESFSSAPQPSRKLIETGYVAVPKTLEPVEKLLHAPVWPQLERREHRSWAF
jgi:hypothetical protein